MRRFSHWTLQYVRDRIGTLHYERKFPTHPWLTRAANEILDSYLKKSDAGLEFGSGRSTLWLSKRIAHLTSVEHDKGWATKVAEMLDKDRTVNIDFRLVSSNINEDVDDNSDYARTADIFESNSLDFVLVDGIHRDLCALAVLDKIRPGGVLVIDNVNWYLPSKSRSPNSRSIADGPKGKVWSKVEQRVADWRRIWTSSGVTDTGFFFKPCS